MLLGLYFKTFVLEIIEKEPKTTPQPIFVCPTPPAPVQVDYETFNNSTITITWIAINDNLNDAEYIPNFDVMDPNDKLGMLTSFVSLFNRYQSNKLNRNRVIRVFHFHDYL